MLNWQNKTYGDYVLRSRVEPGRWTKHSEGRTSGAWRPGWKSYRVTKDGELIETFVKKQNALALIRKLRNGPAQKED